MAHKWNQPVNRHAEHTVTCQLCGVFVERVFEGGRGVNYNTVLNGERVRGLAPKCPGKIDELTLAADAVATEEQDEPADEVTEEVPAEEPEPEDEDETDELAALCEKYEAMNRKSLDKLAAGKVKNYKKLPKASLVFELALKEQQELAHQA